MTSVDPFEDDLSLEKLLRDESKHGVFEADFENRNGTTVTVRDGDSVLLNCRVYLLHDKTVSKHEMGKGMIFAKLEEYRCVVGAKAVEYKVDLYLP